MQSICTTRIYWHNNFHYQPLQETKRKNSTHHHNQLLYFTSNTARTYTTTSFARKYSPSSGKRFTVSVQVLRVIFHDLFLCVWSAGTLIPITHSCRISTNSRRTCGADNTRKCTQQFGQISEMESGFREKTAMLHKFLYFNQMLWNQQHFLHRSHSHKTIGKDYTYRYKNLLQLECTQIYHNTFFLNKITKLIQYFLVLVQLEYKIYINALLTF